ncbi:MAG: threonine/serine dehydratase, partial [Candidatus Hermodarchaeota archaeon]
MFKEIKNASKFLSYVAKVTPVMTSRTLNSLTEAKQVYIKCENFQRTGSFKFRGAWNGISHIPVEQRNRGIIAHSSGNFAQAVALTCQILKIKATIVMPENATQSKVAATKGYGAEVIFSETKPGDRESKTSEIIQKHGYALIHPFDNYHVINGAGTTALELMEQVRKIDLFLAPVGGGGLVSGCAIAIKNLNPRTTVIAVEPENANDTYRSFQKGERLPVVNPNTIADGLRTSVGEKTFPIIQKYVDSVITVSEADIIEAMRFYWERMKLVVEPSGAVALAGLLYGNITPSLIKEKKIGVVLSGGNIDLS